MDIGCRRRLDEALPVGMGGPLRNLRDDGRRRGRRHARGGGAQRGDEHEQAGTDTVTGVRSRHVGVPSDPGLNCVNGRFGAATVDDGSQTRRARVRGQFRTDRSSRLGRSRGSSADSGFSASLRWSSAPDDPMGAPIRPKEGSVAPPSDRQRPRGKHPERSEIVSCVGKVEALVGQWKVRDDGVGQGDR